MDGGQDGVVEKRMRLQEGGKMDWRIKVEMERWRKRGKKEGEGENMGPVVVEMSATGAAEMERAA